jgi:hypothetical protein
MKINFLLLRRFRWRRGSSSQSFKNWLVMIILPASGRILMFFSSYILTVTTVTILLIKRNKKQYWQALQRCNTISKSTPSCYKLLRYCNITVTLVLQACVTAQSFIHQPFNKFCNTNSAKNASRKKFSGNKNNYYEHPHFTPGNQF